MDSFIHCLVFLKRNNDVVIVNERSAVLVLVLVLEQQLFGGTLVVLSCNHGFGFFV